MATAVTHGITQQVDPAEWQEHLFGLSPERWDSLKDKAFWITGAGTGYGRSLATALAAAGSTVFLTGRRVEKLQESIEKMSLLGVQSDSCYVLPVDITDLVQIKGACSKISSLCSTLHGLVNNAALPPRASLQGESLDYWNKLMDTNVTAPWLLTREIFPHMQKGKIARVLFITSEAGWAFTPGAGVYNVSKAALNNLSASMAEEYSTDFSDMDIQMNCLSAGEARTEMNQASPYSPYAIVGMALLLLSHPNNGPNGKFFYRDGRHLEFTYASKYEKSLL